MRKKSTVLGVLSIAGVVTAAVLWAGSNSWGFPGITIEALAEIGGKDLYYEITVDASIFEKDGQWSLIVSANQTPNGASKRQMRGGVVQAGEQTFKFYWHKNDLLCTVPAEAFAEFDGSPFKVYVKLIDEEEKEIFGLGTTLSHF